MSHGLAAFAGFPVPFHSPVLLGVLAVHILAGLGCVITGVLAMLSRKGPGRHRRFGTSYVRCLAVVFATMTVLSGIRWAEDYPLFLLGLLSFTAALAARRAARRRPPGWVRAHLSGMGLSYVFLLTAFYVDNGKSLPVWRALPRAAYWLVPAAVGVPLILRALRQHPLARRAGATN